MATGGLVRSRYLRPLAPRFRLGQCRFVNPLLSDLSPEVAELLGDPHPLVQRLAGAGGSWDLPLTGAWEAEAVRDARSLARFIECHQREMLVPIELPAIVRAWGYAERGEARELLALDRELGESGRFGLFAAASQAVGRSQLRRLLPVRDARWIRRYWRAAEAGEAHAWHMLVYGGALALFALPLRQGLAHYIHQTTASLIGSATGPLGLAPAVRDRLIAESTVRVPEWVTGAIGQIGGCRLTIT